MADLRHQFTGLGFVNPMRGCVYDPVTLTTLFGVSAGTASTIGTIATVASPVLGVMGALANAQAKQEQKREYEREAAETRIMASVEAERMRRQARQTQSRARTSMAEGGALSGTSFGVLDQNAVAQELDALTVEFQGEQRAKGAEFKASQVKSGFLDVFSSAVSGFSQMDPLNLTPGGQFVGGGGRWVKS